MKQNKQTIRLNESQLRNIIRESIKNVLREACDENENSYMQYRELLTAPQWQVLIALAKEKQVEQITSSAFLQKYNISGTTARRTIQSLIDKDLVLALPQKSQTVYQVYDVFFMHWLAREY